MIKTRYADLNIGDIFTVDRENNKVAYIKDEFWYQEISTGVKRRKLNGCTKCRKIGEKL